MQPSCEKSCTGHMAELQFDAKFQNLVYSTSVSKVWSRNCPRKGVVGLQY